MIAELMVEIILKKQILSKALNHTLSVDIT
jgi:hypothetical protein